MKGFDTMVLRSVAKYEKNEHWDEKTEYVRDFNGEKETIYLSEIQKEICINLMFQLIHDGYLMLYEITDENDDKVKGIVGEIRVEHGICVDKDSLCDVRNK